MQGKASIIGIISHRYYDGVMLNQDVCLMRIGDVTRAVFEKFENTFARPSDQNRDLENYKRPILHAS